MSSPVHSVSKSKQSPPNAGQSGKPTRNAISIVAVTIPKLEHDIPEIHVKLQTQREDYTSELFQSSIKFQLLNVGERLELDRSVVIDALYEINSGSYCVQDSQGTVLYSNLVCGTTELPLPDGEIESPDAHTSNTMALDTSENSVQSEDVSLDTLSLIETITLHKHLVCKLLSVQKKISSELASKTELASVK